MSSLTRMGIQGIRSFSPDEEQTIKFHKPLTLICGPNGTGKSTIIECLKYATTGILPPSIKNGQAFIFDPDLANTSEVKAAIRLLFKNRTNRLTFVSRNFQLTQKKSKKEFKALDGTLKLKDSRTNQEVVHSHRCSDLDKLVPELLGVSPAILDNVLFCHQEEANWPLRESAELKKKFDDIFESTRYTKALVELKKQRKDAGEKAKDANRDVAILATHLERSKQLRDELAVVKDKLDQTTVHVGDLAKEITAGQAVVEELAAQVQQYEGSFEEIKALAGVISERERMVDRERRELNVSQDMEAMDEQQVQAAAQQAAQSVAQARAGMATWQTKIASMDRQRAQLAQEVERLNTERAGVQGRMEEFHRQTKRHEQLVHEFRVKYAKHFASASSSSSSSLAEYKECMSRVVKDKRDELEQLEQGAAGEFEHFSRQVHDVRGKLATLTHEKQAKQDLYDKLTVKLDETRQQLLALGGEGGADDGLLKDAKLKHRRAEKHLEQLLDSSSAAERNASIERLSKETEQLDGRRKAMDAGIALLESQQTAQTRLDNKREEIGKKLKLVGAHIKSLNFANSSSTEDEALVAAILAELRPVLQDQQQEQSSKKARLSLGGEDGGCACSLPDKLAKRCSDQVKQLCDVVGKQVERKRGEADELRINRDRVIAQSTICDGKLSQLQDECAHLDAERRRIEQSLPKQGYHLVLDEFAHELGGTTDGSTTTTRGQMVAKLLREQVAQATEAKLNMAHLKGFYKQMMKKLEKQPDTCPTCEQNCAAVVCTAGGGEAATIEVDSRTVLHFEPGKEYRGGKALQLMMYYKTESTAFEAKLGEFEQDIAQLERKLQVFLQHDQEATRLHAVEQDLFRRQDARVRLEQERDNLARESARLVKLHADLDFPIKNLERQQDTVKDVLRTARDAERMEQELAKELALLSMDSSTSSSSTSNECRGLTLQQARLRAREIDDAKTSKYAEMQREMQAQRQAQLESEAAGEDVKRAGQLVGQLERENAQRIQLANERTRLAEEQNQAFCQSEALKTHMAPLEFECGELERARQNKAQANKQQVERARRELELVQSDEQQLAGCKEQIDLALRSGVKDALHELDTSLQEERARLAKIGQEHARFVQELAEAEDSLRGAAQQQQRVQNAGRLLKAKQELAEIVSRRQQLEQQVAKGRESASDVRQELAQMQDALAQKRMRKEKLLGGREATEVQHKQLTSQLQEPNLRDIAKRHADKLCDAVVTNLACKDLEKYTKALDNALMLFHSEKIEDINRRVRELWQVIYKGGDIDHVELKAERGTGVSAHTYTYRVVFRKNHTEMDMKGRCSAGQKVLASLVIRLALADTFSMNCGVMALDEPSANLDVENKRGLAEALADIILARRNQENFQLIVITHDDDFVEVLQAQLGTNGGPYWRLSREQDATGKYVSVINEETGA